MHKNMKVPKLTHERLLEAFDYNPETGHFVWKVYLGGRVCKVGHRAGYLKWTGYRTLCIDGEYIQEHRLAWFYVHGEWPTELIDHINHDKSDNRISNLRAASHALNMAHKPNPRKDNKSGVTGVYFEKNKKKWAVTLAHQHGGFFTSFDDAVKRRKEMESSEFGDFSPKS